MEDSIALNWERPESLKYPKIWHTFRAKDTESDELVEYRIQDLPESRFDEVLNVILPNFLKDEPISEAYDLINNAEAFEDIRLMWKCVLNQKMAVACFKEGSDEIVGINANYVICKGDRFFEDLGKRNRSAVTRTLTRIYMLLYANFDAFEHYGVDKYLSSFGLVVSGKYRGRAIGEQFLNTRRAICRAYDIKISPTIFTSNISNRIADKVGFKLDVCLSFDEIRNKYPELNLPPVKSHLLTLKTIQL